jgi:hypothetical protein
MGQKSCANVSYKKNIYIQEENDEDFHFKIISQV